MVECFVFLRPLGLRLVVVVRQTRQHKLYGKVIRVSKRYKAHDEDNSCRMGDQVRIVESRPYSKDKHWAVQEVLQRAEQVDTYDRDTNFNPVKF